MALLYNVLKVHTDEIGALETEACKYLYGCLELDLPPHLRGCEDELALFDYLQPSVRGKFTGTTLLKLIQSA